MFCYPIADAPAPPPPPPPPAPAPAPQLAPDETIINPHYMMQLLVYGLRMGQRQDVEWNSDNLLAEGEVRVLLFCIRVRMTDVVYRGLSKNSNAST